MHIHFKFHIYIGINIFYTKCQKNLYVFIPNKHRFKYTLVEKVLALSSVICVVLNNTYYTKSETLIEAMSAINNDDQEIVE